MLHEEWLLGANVRLGHVAEAIETGPNSTIALAVADLLAWTAIWAVWAEAPTIDERIAIMERAGM